jgi:hypothetical protein
MNRLLRQGDVFRSPLLGKVRYKTEFVKGAEPRLDRTKLSTDTTGGPIVYMHWTEHGKDGWRRERDTPLDTTAPNFSASDWEVLETKYTGGGTGMGPHDIYPDGHHVRAKLVGGDVTVEFYQSGYFSGMIPREDVQLVKAGP